MKCPKCQAKLLPVDGELFCLQCGTALAMRDEKDSGTLKLEETTDPLLQRAIMDVVRKPVHFRLPISQAPPPPAKTTSFNSMRAILAPPRAAMTPGGGAVAIGGSMPAPEAHEVPSPKVAKKKRRLFEGWKTPSAAWMAGIAAFAAFVITNGAISAYYSSRVYPGVKVGQTDLGGLPLGSLHQRLAGMAPSSKLSVEVGTTKYGFDLGEAGKLDIERTEREVTALGHNTPLPLAGAIQSLLSKPVVMRRVADEAAVKALAVQIATRINHKPSNALAMVVNGQAFVISEKVGSEVNTDKLATDITSAYEANNVVKLSPEKLSPLVTASTFAPDIQEAQQMLSLSLQIKVRTATYTVSASQIGSWLAFRGPGKGVALDGAGVSAYVASLPGTFDRAGVTNALVGAIQGKQSLSYRASTKKTAAPKLASVMPALPIQSYGYCVAADAAADQTALEAKAASVLGQSSGWALGGRLRFVKVDSDCNFTLRLMEPKDMSGVDPACAGQATCQVGQLLALNVSSWMAAPEVWKGGLEAYRGEMITHEVGHWLGFEHASCTNKQDVPVLSAPTLVIGGCSPNWYAVPAEAQGTKVLPGF